MSFRGISADNDARFTNAEKKLLQSMKFPPEFSKKVDMTKVNLQVLKPWVAKQITDALSFEDEVVIELVYSMLEPRYPDPRKCQLSLTGFLHKSTPAFMKEMWNLLLSAQESAGGIPAKILDEKKQELQRRRVENSKIDVSLQNRMETRQSPTQVKVEETHQSFDDFERPLRMRQSGDHAYQGGRMGRRQELDDFGRQKRSSVSPVNRQRRASIQSPDIHKRRQDRGPEREGTTRNERIPSPHGYRHDVKRPEVKKEIETSPVTHQSNSNGKSPIRVKTEPVESFNLASSRKSSEPDKSRRHRSRDRKRSRSRSHDRERSPSHDRSSRRRSSRDRGTRRHGSRDRYSRRHHRSRRSSRDQSDDAREHRSSNEASTRKRRSHRSRSRSTHRHSRRSAHARGEDRSPDRGSHRRRRERSRSRDRGVRKSHSRSVSRSRSRSGSHSRTRAESEVEGNSDKVKDSRAAENALREKLLRQKLLSESASKKEGAVSNQS